MSAVEARHELRWAFKRIERLLPAKMAALMRWLRHPASRWVRIPAGLLLIVGGFLAILPVFGLWMTPLGLMLIAADIPFLRRPMARFAHWCAKRIETWQSRRSAG